MRGTELPGEELPGEELPGEELPGPAHLAVGFTSGPSGWLSPLPTAGGVPGRSPARRSDARATSARWSFRAGPPGGCTGSKGAR